MKQCPTEGETQAHGKVPGKKTQMPIEGGTRTGKRIQSTIEGDPGLTRLTRRIRWSQVPRKVPGKEDHAEGDTRKQTQGPGMKTQALIEDDRIQQKKMPGEEIQAITGADTKNMGRIRKTEEQFEQ